MRAKLPGCDHYVVTTLLLAARPQEVRGRHDARAAHPAQARSSTRRSSARAGEHVLVYQTSTSDTKLLDELQTRARAEVRRLRPSQATRSSGNCTLKEFSEDGFVEDLATRARGRLQRRPVAHRRGASTSASRSSACRCSNQYEQVLNARYLEELGYGLDAPTRSTPSSCASSSREAPKYAARVAKHKQDGNRELFALVDRLLERFAHKAKRSRQARGDVKVARSDAAAVSLEPADVAATGAGPVPSRRRRSMPVADGPLPSDDVDVVVIGGGSQRHGRRARPRAARPARRRSSSATTSRSARAATRAG